MLISKNYSSFNSIPFFSGRCATDQGTGLTMVGGTPTIISVLNTIYPTEPSKVKASNFCASTANSIGKLFNTSLQ
ncbi:hypothetical protein MATR_14650 [Marivirga tractuosa]|uniref:6-phosphogluconate dehydrogenase, NAD-binding protein n=1 Tax=Marivirga tractuosa (strain ATCC 23168 / DSM 4126 / NBRC 15989 / NCIMB 1408 / VKM B-1430 / H-43) TaxID=643867 RepID=E4TT61_MARTH|nr:6-phosphogluconate dehydrogenase, NAD-binding protein [Marivirga tractuosa DSM 4126]BDD14640.1 hypothetical protein MATR_14650 [Marivirga tractuosa]